MLAFTFVMLGLHTVGTPLIYSYLFFWKHHSGLHGVGRANKHEGSEQPHMYVCMYMHMHMHIPHMCAQDGTYMLHLCPEAHAHLIHHGAALEALKEQELSDYHRQKVEEAKTYIKNEKVVSADPDAPEQPRIEAEEVLPGYMLKLTDGYEYRTYSFELLETIRKVALVSGG